MLDGCGISWAYFSKNGILALDDTLEEDISEFEREYSDEELFLDFSDIWAELDDETEEELSNELDSDRIKYVSFCFNELTGSKAAIG